MLFLGRFECIVVFIHKDFGDLVHLQAVCGPKSDAHSAGSYRFDFVRRFISFHSDGDLAVIAFRLPPRPSPDNCYYVQSFVGQ